MWSTFSNFFPKLVDFPNFCKLLEKSTKLRENPSYDPDHMRENQCANRLIIGSNASSASNGSDGMFFFQLE